MVRIVSQATLLEDLRHGQHRRTQTVTWLGEQLQFDIEFNNGQALRYDLPRPLASYFGPRGELMTLGNHRNDDLAQVMTVDLAIAMDRWPTVYQQIYRTITNGNLPLDIRVGTLNNYTGVVFLERREGQEIHWGTRERGAYETTPLRSFALGFQWTKELVMFDETWRFADMTEAIGRAHSALLDHIHLRPILDYPYPPANVTAPAYDPNEDPRVSLWYGIDQALADAADPDNSPTGSARRPTVMLTHSSNTRALQQALDGMDLTIVSAGAAQQAPLPAIANMTIVEYDTRSIWEGERKYTYEGVDPSRVYLIEPRQFFIEFVRQALQVEQGPEPDFSRYIIGQLRADTWRAIAATPEAAVQVLELPDGLRRRRSTTTGGTPAAAAAA